MSFLFGARPGRRDEELAAANERNRRAFARDINDQRALAFDPTAYPSGAPRRRRSGLWMVWAVIAFLVAGAFGLLPTVGGAHIEVSCTTPGVALSTYSVPAAATVQWRITGPNAPRYAVAVDATAVSQDAGSPLRADAGLVVTPQPVRMSSCQQTGPPFAAPRGAGPHLVRLFRDDGTGWVQVAQVALTVR